MLTATAQYALRALAHLATAPEGGSFLGRDLAERTHIPANYLSKILLTLRNAGFVAAVRGHNGGYRLAKPASEIPLVEVVRLFEGPQSDLGCLLGEHVVCSDDRPCAAHEAWKKVKTAYVEFLTTKTVAEISTLGATPAMQQTVANSKKKRKGRR